MSNMTNDSSLETLGIFKSMLYICNLLRGSSKIRKKRMTEGAVGRKR